MREYTRKHVAKVKSSTGCSFGLIFSTVFALIALYPLLAGGALRLWSLIIAGVFLLLCVLL